VAVFEPLISSTAVCGAADKVVLLNDRFDAAAVASAAYKGVQGAGKTPSAALIGLRVLVDVVEEVV